MRKNASLQALANDTREEAQRAYQRWVDYRKESTRIGDCNDHLAREAFKMFVYLDKLSERMHRHLGLTYRPVDDVAKEA